MERYTFRVYRFDPEKDEKGRFQEFEVPVKGAMTVLEGLYYILENLDGSLAFRSSCRAGVCGSCGMHINGKYRLACETQIKLLNSRIITVQPLGSMRVIKDLLVDMDSFWQKYKYVKPYLLPSTPPPERERPQSIDERAKLDGLYECILCGCCTGSCTVASTDKDYLGPAALLWANRFVEDSRDGAMIERLKLVDFEHGVWRCHTIFSCQEVCPKELSPTSSIMNMSRKIIAMKLGLIRKK